MISWVLQTKDPSWQQSHRGGNQHKWSMGSGEAGDRPAVISCRLRTLSMVSLPELLWASLQPSNFREVKMLHSSLGPMEHCGGVPVIKEYVLLSFQS